MNTVTISLPEPVAKQIDAEKVRLGFATRSEFMRTLLRRYFSGELTRDVFSPRPLDEIKSELVKTHKYNRKFVDSVIRGLSKSSIYAR